MMFGSDGATAVHHADVEGVRLVGNSGSGLRAAAPVRADHAVAHVTAARGEEVGRLRALRLKGRQRETRGCERSTDRHRRSLSQRRRLAVEPRLAWYSRALLRLPAERLVEPGVQVAM
jgi:hypothetical protein